MIVDCVMYNGEKELWDIHYNVLKDVVDEFIVIEAPTTFSGLSKPLYFNEIKSSYDVKYHVIDERYTKDEIALAESSPNTRGASHWKHEFLQKESIKKALTHLKNDDIVFIGDVDEIWDTRTLRRTFPLKLRLRVYTYYLNNRSSEKFWGTLVSPYGMIKELCLNHFRTNAPKSNEMLGWHFTSMGGYREVVRKLINSYTEDSYWTPNVQQNLEKNIAENKDFLGRDFTYLLDERDWPRYLKENREKYKHLCKVV